MAPSTVLFLMLIIVSYAPTTQAQFLRQGFSSQEDFRGEMKLEDNEALSGMTREMFLMQDMNWELEPPRLLVSLPDSKLQRHIQSYLRDPVELKLLKKKGKYGLRAVAITQKGQKLRAFWRQGVSEPIKTSEFVRASYDDAVRSRLFTVEFEVQLPPVNNGSKELPSVVYSIPLEPGSMNPKSLVPRGAGRLRLYPTGRSDSAVKCMDVGTCNVGIHMRPGLVDPTWAKGKQPFFRKGRSTGLL